MALNAYVYVGFFCGSIAFNIWTIYIIPPLYTILCIGITLNFTYPVVFQEAVEIRWFFYPFLNKSFAYSKIDHVLFLRKVTYGAHFTMTIFMKDGKKNRYGDLGHLQISVSEVILFYDYRGRFGGRMYLCSHDREGIIQRI